MAKQSLFLRGEFKKLDPLCYELNQELVALESALAYPLEFSALQTSSLEVSFTVHFAALKQDFERYNSAVEWITAAVIDLIKKRKTDATIENMFNALTLDHQILFHKMKDFTERQHRLYSDITKH
jgi:hypothetical protein